MEQNGRRNWVKTLTEKQKIGLAVASIIIISLIIVLVAMLVVDNDDSDKVVDVAEGTYTNENGDTVTVKTTTTADGEVIRTETKEDAYGNITTTDPSLITTYFPYQVVREHDGYGATMRYFLSIDQDKRVINATIEECDVEGDKALVQEYINSIPLDLSGYVVNYETFVADAVCEG